MDETMGGSERLSDLESNHEELESKLEDVDNDSFKHRGAQRESGRS